MAWGGVQTVVLKLPPGLFSASRVGETTAPDTDILTFGWLFPVTQQGTLAWKDWYRPPLILLRERPGLGRPHCAESLSMRAHAASAATSKPPPARLASSRALVATHTCHLPLCHTLLKLAHFLPLCTMGRISPLHRTKWIRHPRDYFIAKRGRPVCAGVEQCPSV